MQPLRPRTGPVLPRARTAGAQRPTGRPYGFAPGPRRPRVKFVGFGLAYLLIRGGLLLLGLMLILVAGAMLAPMMSGGRGGQSASLGFSIIITVTLVALAWLGYCVTASMLAFKGKIAGVIMGLVDAGLIAVLQILQLVMVAATPAENKGVTLGVGFVLMLLNGVIILMAILALRTNAAMKRMPMQQPAPGMPMHTPVPAPHPLMRAPLPGAPAPLVPAPLPVAPAPAPIMPTAAAAPTPEFPHASLLQLLAVAASVEPEHAPARMQRAAAAAAKLLGPQSHYEVNQWLSAPVPVKDLNAQVTALAPFVKANPRMAQGVLKCAQYALKDAQGAYTPGAQAAIETMESALA